MLKRACCPASSTTRCGAVLAAVALASTSLFALAARPASGDERGSSDALREGSLDLDRSARESRGEDGGVAGACTVTWPVFATTAVELSISVMGGPCSGDAQAGNITIDLDGDGTEELLRSDDWTPGQGDGDAAVRCLRRVGGAWNDEVLLLWDPAVTTYPGSWGRRVLTTSSSTRPDFSIATATASVISWSGPFTIRPDRQASPATVTSATNCRRRNPPPPPTSTAMASSTAPTSRCCWSRGRRAAESSEGDGLSAFSRVL